MVFLCELWELGTLFVELILLGVLDLAFVV